MGPSAMGSEDLALQHLQFGRREATVGTTPEQIGRRDVERYPS